MRLPWTEGQRTYHPPHPCGHWQFGGSA